VVLLKQVFQRDEFVLEAHRLVHFTVHAQVKTLHFEGAVVFLYIRVVVVAVLVDQRLRLAQVPELLRLRPEELERLPILGDTGDEGMDRLVWGKNSGRGVANSRGTVH